MQIELWWDERMYIGCLLIIMITERHHPDRDHHTTMVQTGNRPTLVRRCAVMPSHRTITQVSTRVLDINTHTTVNKLQSSFKISNARSNSPILACDQLWIDIPYLYGGIISQSIKSQYLQLFCSRFSRGDMVKTKYTQPPTSVAERRMIKRPEEKNNANS